MNLYTDFSDATSYATFMSEQEPPLLAALRRETIQTVHGSQMLSTSLQGRLLSLLSRLVQPQKVLEVGTYTGYSALCLAEGLHPAGKLHTIDRHHYPLAERYFQKANMQQQITYHIGKAADLLPTIEGPFDLVFLDADKKQYSDYSHHLIPQIKPGGLMIADNVLWKGLVLSEKGCQQDLRAAAMRQIAAEWKEESQLHPLLLPFGDGLLVAQKR